MNRIEHYSAKNHKALGMWMCNPHAQSFMSTSLRAHAFQDFAQF